MASPLVRRLANRKAGILLGIGAAALVGAAALTQTAGAAPFAAEASVSPQIQYRGDSVGTTFTVTVDNVGTTDSIGAVQVGRPGKAWTIIGCPSAPSGWTAHRSDTMCRYRSAAGTADDILPGDSSSAFEVTATVAPGTHDLTGTWSVKVSRSSSFDKPSKLTAAASEPPGLGITAHSFQVLDAVVDPAAVTPGDPCPAPSKSAITGSTGHTVVICGRNRTTGTLTPTESQSSLGGTFVASHGSFSSGAVSPTGSSVVLGSWDDVTITSTAGPNKTVISRIGAASNQTSPLTTLTGYEALNNPPDAVDDETTTNEDTAVSLDPRFNDTDPDGDPLTISAVDTTGTSGSVTITGGGTGVSYDPNGQFENLGVGQTASDTFTYTVSDPFGASDTATVTVTITGVNDPPTAVDDVKTVGEDNTGTTVNVLGNDTDPDTADSLAVIVVDTTGTTGTVTNNGGTDVTYDPNGQFEGLAVGETATDTFTYTVSDNHGATDTATVTITIVGANDAPDAVDDGGSGFGTASDTPFTTGNVLANDTDPDGDVLSVQSLSLGGTLGLVTDNGDGTFAYDPNGAFDDLPSGDTATDTFGYVVSDGNGGTDSAVVSITITGVNHAPDAVNDAKTVGEDDTGTIINVLANDTDADGDSLSVIAVDTTGTSGTVTNNGGTDVTYDPNGQFEHLDDGETATDTFTYTVSDGTASDIAVVTVTVTGVNDSPTAVDDEKTVGEDNTGTTINVLGNDTDPDDTLTVTAVTSPTNGGAVTNNGTDVTYDPNGQFESLGVGETATDTFTYTVSDGTATDTATVTVTIVGANDAPDAVADAKTVGKDDPPTVINVLANDTDADASDILSVTSVDSTGTLGSVTITNGGADVTYDPNGQFDDLGPAETATDTFVYTASDGNGGTDTAVVTVTVTGANAPPVANDDADTVGEDSSGATIDVLGNDTDANGDTLTVTAVTSATNGGAVTNNGTDVTYDPNGQFENLDTGETAQDTFTYTVSDGTDTDTATVTITVTGANDAPDAVDDAAGVGENNTGTTINVLANDTDPDVETLTVSAVDATGTTGTVTITNGGADVSYDPNGQFEGLDTGETAQDIFTYTVTDGTATDVATVTVTVTGSNDPPNAVDDAQDVSEDSTGDTVDVLANDTDVDVETLTVTAVTSPTNGGAVTNNGSNVTYDPNGQFEHLAAGETATDTFTYTVTDGTATDTATVTITITGVNDAPNAVADSFDAIGNTGLFVGTTKPAGQAGKEITGSILTNDTDPDSPQASLVAEPVTDAPTTLGGTITIESDGNFTYHPDDGDVAVTDTFTYRVCDASPCNSGTVANSTGTLNLPLTGQVWYVKNNQTAGGDGTSDTPFDTLVEAETASGANDTTFVFDGNDTSTNLDTGYEMNSGERLIGELAGLSLDPDGGGGLPLSDLYPSTPGARPTLTATNEDVVALDDGNVVRALQLDPQGTGGGIGGAAGDTGGGTIQDIRIIDTGTAGTQPGFELDATTGTFDVSDLVVDNSAATGVTNGSIGVRLNNAGTVNFASAGTISVTTKGARGLVAAATSLGTGSVFDDVTVTASDSGGVSLNTTTGTVSLGDGTGTDLSLTTTGGAGLSVNTATNVTVGAAGTDNVQSTGGPALDITGAGGNYAFDVVNSTNSPSSGIILMNIGTGTVDVDDGTISGYTQWGLNHSGGSGNVDMGADINDGAGVNVVVNNRTGGAVTFTGAVADSADASGGAWASNNANTTIRFEGGVALDTGAGDAFVVSNTGTVVVTDANGVGVAPDNTVTSTTGRGVVITGTTIGSDGVTFRSISSNGASNGIVLTNTGTSGGLTVTGNGGACATTADACTGGTIQATTGDAVSLTSTRQVVLNRMKVINSLGNGIRGAGVTDFALRDSVVDNNGNDAATDEAGVHLTNLAGNSEITRTLVANSPEDNARIVNASGTLTQLDVTDSIFRDTDTVSPGNNGLLIQADGGSITADVLGSTFLRNRANGLQVITNGTGSMNIEVDDSAGVQSTFNDNNIGVNIAHNSSGSFSFGVRDLTIDGLNVSPGTGGSASPININLAGAATTTMAGRVTGNTLTNSNSTTGPGIRLIGNGTATMTVLVDANNISQVANRGIEVIARDGSNRINATITNNSVTLNHALAADAIRIDSGVTNTDTTTICGDIRGNTATTTAVGLFGIKVRQRFAGTSFILEDYAGSATDDAAVQAFLSGLNNAATTSADHGGAGFTTIADCPTPP